VPDDAESILATIEMRCAEQVAGSRQPTDRQAMTRARRGYQLKGFAKLPPNLNGDQHRVWRRLLELIQ